MKIRRFVFPLFLSILIAAGLTIMRPRDVHAQDCGAIGQPACPPSGGDQGGGKRKKPTLMPPKPTATPSITPAPTETPTADPIYLTAIPCWEGIYRKTPQPELPTPSWADIQYDAPQCITTSTPTINPALATADMCEEIALANGTPEPDAHTGCWGTITPSPTTSIFIPQVEGPKFLLPGEAVTLILVMIGFLLIGGLIFAIRRRLGNR